MRVNDCRTRFEFLCPQTSIPIHAVYDHNTGRLDLEPDFDALEGASRLDCRTVQVFCEELGINYFYFNEVRESLIEEGVDAAEIPN